MIFWIGLVKAPHATDEIVSPIASIQAETNRAVLAIQNIRITISKINELSNILVEAVEKQRVETSDIAQSLNAASSNAQDVSDDVTMLNKIVDTVLKVQQSMANKTEDVISASDNFAKIMREFLSVVSIYVQRAQNSSPVTMVNEQDILKIKASNS